MDFWYIYDEYYERVKKFIGVVVKDPWVAVFFRHHGAALDRLHKALNLNIMQTMLLVEWRHYDKSALCYLGIDAAGWLPGHACR